jgi:hypothetical protein
MRHCRCEFRKRIFLQADGVLRDAIGMMAAAIVQAVVLHDRPYGMQAIGLLRLGLSALAHHFGLTPRANGHIGKSSIANRVPS